MLREASGNDFGVDMVELILLSEQAFKIAAALACDNGAFKKNVPCFERTT